MLMKREIREIIGRTPPGRFTIQWRTADSINLWPAVNSHLTYLRFCSVGNSKPSR
jgi:hypothetical protein